MYKRKSTSQGSLGITPTIWAFSLVLRVCVSLWVSLIQCILLSEPPLSPWTVVPLSVSLHAGPGVRHVAHLLSPFNSSLPIRLFPSLFLCSRLSSLLGQVPFLLMRWKWAVGIAKRSRADLWWHFITAHHENANRARRNKAQHTHRQWRHWRTQWHRKLRG